VRNRFSFVDAILLWAASPRPIVFIVDHRNFSIPAVGSLSRLGKAIPIAPEREDASSYAAAFERARKVLGDGELLCNFPEGGLTRDGALGGFRPGLLGLLEMNPVPVVPLALRYLWGSFLSRADGAAMKKLFRRGVCSRVGLVAAPALPPAGLRPGMMGEHVARLLAA
jgi:1-acyl-sn-glycerol-3-phosphate acyltransferase